MGEPGGVNPSVARPAERIATAAFLEPAFPLFLLFLQEIISWRHRLRRRNPGVPAAQRSKEQRVTARRPAVNPCKSAKANLAGKCSGATNSLPAATANRTTILLIYHIIGQFVKEQMRFCRSIRRGTRGQRFADGAPLGGSTGQRGASSRLHRSRRSPRDLQRGLLRWKVALTAPDNPEKAPRSFQHTDREQHRTVAMVTETCQYLACPQPTRAPLPIIMAAHT
jgi:hypothetical protein